jgi:MYXO-CTERM domain-containing protein
MAIRHLAAAAALAFTAAAAPMAHAAISISVLPTDLPLPIGQQMVVDFDHPTAAGFTFTQGPGSFVRSGALGLESGVSAPPPGDVSMYETVTGGGFATLTSAAPMTRFSFFLGSPDSYNSIRFEGAGFDVLLAGSALFSPPTAFNGDQSVGRRITYDFGGAKVNKITFLSSGNSFEFDDIAAGVSAAPEPASWAIMLMGMFGLGGLLRSQRRRQVALAA